VIQDDLANSVDTLIECFGSSKNSISLFPFKKAYGIMVIWKYRQKQTTGDMEWSIQAFSVLSHN